VNWGGTCADQNQEMIFRSILQKSKPTKIIEIGTLQGVSTALMAEYAPVITVDVIPNATKDKVWALLKVSDKITSRVFRSSRTRDSEIANAAKECDFAFIDGSHLMPDIERDFSLCGPCKRILLHDYWAHGEDWPDVKEFVDRLATDGYYYNFRVYTEIHPPFAYVELLD
jgi:predicted O-methyltransferase YrrM